MKYLHIVLAGVILGIESRSLSPSSFDEALKVLELRPTVNQIEKLNDEIQFPSIEVQKSFVDPTLRTQNSFVILQGEKLEKLLNEFMQKIEVNSIAGDGKLETHWLKYLKIMPNDIYGESLENLNDLPAESTALPSLQIFQNTNGLKDLVDSGEMLDIYYQYGQDDGTRHVKSRHEDSSASFPLVQEEILDPEMKTDAETIGENDKNDENDAVELDAMLVDLQSQLNRMRDNLGRLCRKRHSA